MLDRWDRIEEFAIDVILERRYGKRAALLRAVLFVLSKVYSLLMRARLWCYQKRLAGVHSLGCLVISVGNLTVGGTGKTPVVEKLARMLSKRGRRVAILSRGYKSRPPPWTERFLGRFLGGFRKRSQKPPPRLVTDGRSLFLDSDRAGDEPFMLANNLKNVVVLVDKDRVKSGRYAIEKFGADTLLLDDGFQYLPLKERLDILLVDRETPFGNRLLLPRGTLREPQDHLKRADLILITKCDGGPLDKLKEELRRYNQHAPLLECRHKPVHLEDLTTHERHPLSILQGLRVGVVSGIARPESFEEGLRKLGAELVYARQFADHHRFSVEEIENAFQRTKARGGRALVVTEKDAVRLPLLDRKLLALYALRVEIEILQGQETLDEWLDSFASSFASSSSAAKTSAP